MACCICLFDIQNYFTCIYYW